jgi:uracil-DNA glycosylase family 4
MDDRSLQELELLVVARLYGLAEARDARGETREEANFTPSGALASHVSRLGWDELRETVRTCQLCGLCKQRKQAVFGVGNESAPWLFIGEGPGADEDEQGEPFVGQAGRLLDSMLAAVGIRRGREAYIANVVKCRPPGNRTPTPQEAAACAPYLDRQIELIKPRLIVALGKTAATRLLDSEASLASLRGRVHRYKGTPLVVTYHPAYLLRSLPEKAKAWEDLVFARRVLRESA